MALLSRLRALDAIPAWGLVVAASLLTGLTIGLAQLPSRVPVGPDLVPDPVDDPGAWELAAHGEAEATWTPEGTIRLTAAARRGRATAWTHLRTDRDDGVWDASVRVRAPGRGRRVQLVVAAKGAGRPLWFGSYRIGADGWGRVPLAVTGRLDGREVQVGVIAVGEGARAELSHVDLVPMRRRAGWTAALVALGAGWLVLGGVVARRAGPLAVVAGAVLVVGVALPRPWVDVVLGRVQHIQLLGVPFALWGQKLLGHAGLFAVVGFAVARRTSPQVALAAAAALALATEASQLLAVSRSASFTDVALDLAGAGAGVAVAAGLRARRARRSEPGSPG